VTKRYSHSSLSDYSYNYLFLLSPNFDTDLGLTFYKLSPFWDLVLKFRVRFGTHFFYVYLFDNLFSNYIIKFRVPKRTHFLEIGY
jgi:hypothetical protein